MTKRGGDEDDDEDEEDGLLRLAAWKINSAV
jgi:hypothetical protein